MLPIPREKSPDSTLAVLKDGYTFISKRCRRHNSDVFQTRLMLQKTLCLSGEAAATLFYDNTRFKRKGAAPHRLKETLLGRGGVQDLDGHTHRQRKALFMSLMTPESLTQLLDLVTAHWRAYIPRWEKMDRIVLFNEVSEILCRAVCKWVGVPLKPSDVKRRTKEFVALIEGAGAVGVRHVQGRLVRNSAEGWIEALIQDIRDRKQNGPPGSPLQLIANHRELNGELLNKHVAAVEVINLLRPTVAVARFITFAALALHDHPECRPRLAAQDDAYAELFAHEVRRFYPFFPFATARVRRDFDWQGYHLPKGTRTLLDLYGTDHDPRLWDAPERFRPERFLTWDHSPFNFIPQGGGTHHAHHRCAGERITIELIKLAATLLTTSMQYTVPPQDLHFSLSQMPSIPKSRFILTNVHPTPQLTTNH